MLFGYSIPWALFSGPCPKDFLIGKIFPNVAIGCGSFGFTDAMDESEICFVVLWIVVDFSLDGLDVAHGTADATHSTISFFVEWIDGKVIMLDEVPDVILTPV